MGDVQRIMYAHVPMVQMMLLAGTITFVCSVLYLFRASWKTDALAEASAELALSSAPSEPPSEPSGDAPPGGLLGLGSASDDRGHPPGGPRRLPGAAPLRRRPERRAVWAAVTGIVIAVDVPIIYFSVKWWKSLHQVQSNPRTVDPQMVQALRWNILAFFLVFIVFLAVRYRIALAARIREVTVPEAGPGAREAVALVRRARDPSRRGRRGRIQGGWEYVKAAYGNLLDRAVTVRRSPSGCGVRGEDRK
jgi:heme exporter protein C